MHVHQHALSAMDWLCIASRLHWLWRWRGSSAALAIRNAVSMMPFAT